jgi:transcriptional regulator with PAS, ATPase and Fis domain
MLQTVAVHSTERMSTMRRCRVARVEPYLFVVVEGSRPDAGGMRVALGGLETLHIGSGEMRSLQPGDGASQRLEIPDPEMSETHARVVRAGTDIVVEVAGSTNGMQVNGALVAKHVLRDSDIIELGQTTLVYRELDETVNSVETGALGSLAPGLATLDPGLARRLDRLARLAPSTLSILLLGETGAGKEALARALHTLSQRPGPFVAVNCGAVPPNLIESQLFGHVCAFSGAAKDELGLVRAAHGGTLLLDEIGDLPSSSQASLLRVLQEGEVLPVGSAHAATVDVRIIAASQKPLDDRIERGLFRRDLYARLAGHTFDLVPLRERLVDLGMIIARLLAGCKLGAGRSIRLQSDAVRAMLRYRWPMNVRELEQCLAAACVLADDGVITADDLPPAVVALATDGGAWSRAVPEGELAPADRRHALLALLTKHEGNLAAVARELRTSRSQLYRLIERYGIEDKP